MAAAVPPTISVPTSARGFLAAAHAAAERRADAAMEEATRTGAGAAVYKGRLVDLASIRQAEVIVKQSEMIAAS